MRRNGQIVQGYPPIIEERKEEEEEEEEDQPVTFSLERNQGVKLSEKSPLSRPGQKFMGQSSRRSQGKIQEMTLSTLDPSSLSSR